MRRKAILICSIMLALAFIPAIKPAHALPSVTSWGWVSPIYSGTDTYHGTTVIAYKIGTDATLVVQVYNDLPKAPFKVYVHMDWATENKTSEEKEIDQNQYYTFQMSIPIPDTANPLVLHSYRIYVKYEDRTTSPATVKYISPTMTGSNFAVYSADQADAQQLEAEYNQWRNSYSTNPWLGMTSKAKELWANAAVEDFLGDESYRAGRFSEAKTHYGNALNYTKNAITSDIEVTASFEDALVGLLDAGQTYLSYQGWAFFVASIGFLLMGIGVIVYLVRRSRPQPS